jgi:hypothetical protein
MHQVDQTIKPKQGVLLPHNHSFSNVFFIKYTLLPQKTRAGKIGVLVPLEILKMKLHG